MCMCAQFMHQNSRAWGVNCAQCFWLSYEDVGYIVVAEAFAKVCVYVWVSQFVYQKARGRGSAIRTVRFLFHGVSYMLLLRYLFCDSVFSLQLAECICFSVCVRVSIRDMVFRLFCHWQFAAGAIVCGLVTKTLVVRCLVGTSICNLHAVVRLVAVAFFVEFECICFL